MLIELLASKKPYVMFDETSTNLWERRLNIWTDAKDPLPLILPSKRGKSVTIYGSIGNCVREKFHFVLKESTNKVDFVSYIETLRANLNVEPNEEVNFILDNHSAHHSHVAIQALMVNNFIPKFLPTHSSNLNSVERVWAKFKIIMARIVAENVMANPYINEEIHLRPMAQQALEIVKE